MAADTTSPSTPQIVVVGGGIVGVILALGLLKQNIAIQLYEQASGFREIGAGIAFSACARRCMRLMNPVILQALERCGAVPISDGSSEGNSLRWIDGYNIHNAQDPSYQKSLARISGSGFSGCRRDQFLEELAREVPSGIIHFNKRLNGLANQKDGKVVLTFVDGTTVKADAVIGCDGIKSRVRQQIFGADNPASYPQYTHKVAYRGLVPMDQAVKVLGEWKAHNFHHHVGPGAHLTHYPVANNKMLNVVVFISDPGTWPGDSATEAEGQREDVEKALSGWHPTVLGIVNLLPKKMIKWALFDLGEFPAPQYNGGRVCLAGDAAHASSPHHGASACLGVEDALCLSILLGEIREMMESPPENQTNCTRPTLQRSLELAFEAFDIIRRPRTQWLVNSSRRVCDLYHQPEWADSRRWVKAETCFEEIRDRSYKIWNFDVDDMVARTKTEYQRRVEGDHQHNGGTITRDSRV